MKPVELPHEIRGLIPYSDLWLWLVTVLAIVAMGVLLAWLWRRLQARKTVPDATQPQIPVTVRVRQSLAYLRPSEPFSRSEQLQHYFALSMALREYMEAILRLPATDRTVPELAAALKKDAQLSVTITGDMLLFLRKADMVKFAERVATIEEAEADRQSVLQWCDAMDRLVQVVVPEALSQDPLAEQEVKP